MNVEPERIRSLNDARRVKKRPTSSIGARSNRRAESNHALAHAAHLANENSLPLLVYEGLTCAYPAANDRLHTFILEAVPERAKALKRLGAGHFFYLRAERTDPDDLLYKLAAKARCVVTDDFPSSSPRVYNSRVPAKIGIPYIAVDSSCIVPMSRHEKRAYGAYTIRPKMHRELPAYLKPVAPIHVKHRWRDDLLPETLKSRRTEITASAIPSLSPPARSTTPSSPPPPSPAARIRRANTSTSSSNSGSVAMRKRATSPQATPPASSALTCTSATSPRSKLPSLSVSTPKSTACSPTNFSKS